MNNKWKPRILIYRSTLPNNLRSSDLLKQIEIDSRPIFGSGSSHADILTEYNAIVIDTMDLTPQHPERYSQLQSFLSESQGIFVFILNEYRGNWDAAFNYSTVWNLLSQEVGFPPSIFHYQRSGSNFKITNQGQTSAFNQYLDGEGKNWQITLKKEFGNSVIPLAMNADNDIVAFTLKSYENRCYFLPQVTDTEELLWQAVLGLVYGTLGTTQPVADWVKEYTLPTYQDNLDEIITRENKIHDLENEKKKFQDEKERLESIRNTLLFRDGIVLQRIVKDVLMLLGIAAEDGPDGREDVTFVHGSKHFVLEVKGLTKSAGEKDVTQLHSKKVQYESEKRVEAKGILIVNAWRTFPLEERNSPDKPVFPDQMMAITRIWKVALVTTQQLFVAYCQRIEGNFNLEEFVEKLSTSVGPLSNYEDIAKYKGAKKQTDKH